MKRILIPVDGSQPAIHAVQAMLTARTYDPVERVDLLSVQIPLKSGKIGRGLPQAEIDAYYQDEGRAALDEACPSRRASRSAPPPTPSPASPTKRARMRSTWARAAWVRSRRCSWDPSPPASCT